MKKAPASDLAESLFLIIDRENYIIKLTNNQCFGNISETSAISRIYRIITFNIIISTSSFAS